VRLNPLARWGIFPSRDHYTHPKLRLATTSRSGYYRCVRCLVTGAAGFIGSHLAEQLVRNGHRVRGVDCFVPYYPRSIKEANLTWLCNQPAFEFKELDLRQDSLELLFEGIDVVFHEAAMAGLSASWTDFDVYMTCNLQATQRLLVAAHSAQVRRVVHVSTSSVYGRHAVTDESGELKPVSPYGVTKLAAERLATAYHEVFGLDVVVLRYFSVYGPRQRPDMGYNIFIDRILKDKPINIFGDGEQTRGNTFVSDCVEATLRAAERGRPGEVYNIGGGEARSVNWAIATLQELLGREAHLNHIAPRPGDQVHTRANIDKARAELGYEPSVSLRTGLSEQVAWQTAQAGAI
jgi:UDP-glucuronate 4-epimerase